MGHQAVVGHGVFDGVGLGCDLEPGGGPCALAITDGATRSFRGGDPGEAGDLDERLGVLVAEVFAYTAAHANKPIRELVRHAILEHYRFVCRERAFVERRLITNALRGELHPQRPAQYMVQVIGSAPKVISPRVGLSEVDVRVSIQALSFTAVRMAVLSPGERESLTGATGEAAEALIEEHVVEAACRLPCPRG